MKYFANRDIHRQKHYSLSGYTVVGTAANKVCVNISGKLAFENRRINALIYIGKNAFSKFNESLQNYIKYILQLQETDENKVLQFSRFIFTQTLKNCVHKNNYRYCTLISFFLNTLLKTTNVSYCKLHYYHPASSHY